MPTKTRKPLILSCTGHRFDGYTRSMPGCSSWDIYERLLEYAQATMRCLKPTEVIAGGALGWDMAIAEAALVAGIPLSLYLPFKNYMALWPAVWVNRMAGFIPRATKVWYYDATNLFESSLMREAYLQRDEEMVKAANILAMMYNGKKAGGTHYTYMYALRYRAAMQSKLKIYNLWRMWESHRLPSTAKELKGWTTVGEIPF